jgi:hypothetical protein
MKRLRSSSSTSHPSPLRDACCRLPAWFCHGTRSRAHASHRQHMPTLGWWRAGIRVPATHFRRTSPPADASQQTAAAGTPAPDRTQWLSAMDHEAPCARFYELTNYNILQESTWGGGEGARDHLRSILAPNSPLPQLSDMQLTSRVENNHMQQPEQPEGRQAAVRTSSSRDNLKEKTSAGLSKVHYECCMMSSTRHSPHF